MIDINTLIQGQQESDEQFMRRLYNVSSLNYRDVLKRLRNESAEEHFRRFQTFEFSLEGTFYIDPRDGENFSDHSYIIRKGIFYAEKKKIMQKFDDEVFNTLKRKPGESLPDWLGRVDVILFRYSPLINDQRTEFSENISEQMKRVNRFMDFKNDIKVQIAVEPIATKLKSAVTLEKEKERARLEVRNQDEFDKEKAEFDKEKAKNKNSNTIRLSKLIVTVIIFGILIVVALFSDWFMVNLKYTSILFGLIYIGVVATNFFSKKYIIK